MTFFIKKSLPFFVEHNNHTIIQYLYKIFFHFFENYDMIVLCWIESVLYFYAFILISFRQTIVNGGDFMKKWLICFQLVFLFTLTTTPLASAASCPTVKPCVIDP
ncbi:hypothetical protein C6X99_15260 [Bacillus pumilus]|nr:hypothetical protein C6X99_15260 [Bacillus pumilus]